MNKLISVIMPVYNVQDYVGRAIESILNQTFTDFEFLIVNDGSSDKSGEICDSYAQKDERIKVIHKENGGAPKARNMAIDIACGQYIYFLDSDDWAHHQMLEDMYNLAIQKNANLVITGYYIDTFYDNEHCITNIQSAPDAFYETKAQFRTNAYKLFDLNLLYTPWNKLYSADYLKSNRILFPNTFWDDFPFNLDVLREIDMVAVSHKSYYHFMRARSESETAKYRNNMYQKREQEHNWMLDIYKHWQINDAASTEMLWRRYIERIIGCIENLTCDDCPLTTYEKKQKIKEILKNPNIKKGLKIARPRSFMMRIMLIPLKLRCVCLCYLEGRYISRVKKSNTRRFAILKASR